MRPLYTIFKVAQSRTGSALGRGGHPLMFNKEVEINGASGPCFYLRTNRTSTATAPRPCSRTMNGLISMSDKWLR